MGNGSVPAKMFLFIKVPVSKQTASYIAVSFLHVCSLMHSVSTL